MKATTQNWLNYAEIDIASCKKLVEDEFLTNSVAFHAQQAVEKCFKAVLEENNLKIPKIHKLILLRKKIERFINFKVDNELLIFTDKVYIETRYPGDMGMLPDGKPTIKEAEELYKFADYIYQKTKELLKTNNPKDPVLNL